MSCLRVAAVLGDEVKRDTGQNTAVKKEQTIPMMSVVAKPLIGPEPKSRRITPVMTEVRLESKDSREGVAVTFGNSLTRSFLPFF